MNTKNTVNESVSTQISSVLKAAAGLSLLTVLRRVIKTHTLALHQSHS